MTMGPRGVILLCAGRGTRMHPLTALAPKCLLPVDGRRVVDHLLDAILARGEREVVAVTGFAAERVRRHLSARYGQRVTIAHNARYEEDVNILSVETGVAALRHPERGYLVVETDLLMDEPAWDAVFDALAGPDSFWVCRGYYGPELTGGIVHADAQGQVDRVEYRPVYDARFEGWPKMVGLLGVAPAQVGADRHCRQTAIAASVAQYYLMPWRENLAVLPCRQVQVDGCFVQSFNTAEDYADTVRRYLALPVATPPAAGRTAPASVEFVPVQRLRHIEGFSQRRVDWLVGKILDEGIWTKPVALDADHDLVLDGQHRMEAARMLGLARVPAVRYRYADLKVWSLRANHSFDWKRVTERALAGQPYPYKTVKHEFPEGGLPACSIGLEALR